MLDLLFLKKNLDGSIEGFESHEFDDSEVGELRELEAELALLLAEEDVEAIGAALEPDSLRGHPGIRELVGGTVRRRRPPLRWPVGRQRPHPDASVGGRARGRRSNDDGRGMRC